MQATTRNESAGAREIRLWLGEHVQDFATRAVFLALVRGDQQALEHIAMATVNTDFHSACQIFMNDFNTEMARHELTGINFTASGVGDRWWLVIHLLTDSLATSIDVHVMSERDWENGSPCTLAFPRYCKGPQEAIAPDKALKQIAAVLVSQIADKYRNPEQASCMPTLAGDPTQFADSTATQELKTANIPVYQGTPSSTRMGKRNVKTTVIGALQFADGQLAVFERCLHHWSVSLTHYHNYTQLSQKLGDSIECNYCANPWSYDYDIYTHKALTEFASFLKNTHGQPVNVDTDRASQMTHYRSPVAAGLSNLTTDRSIVSPPPAMLHHTEYIHPLPNLPSGKEKSNVILRR